MWNRSGFVVCLQAFTWLKLPSNSTKTIELLAFKDLRCCLFSNFIFTCYFSLSDTGNWTKEELKLLGEAVKLQHGSQDSQFAEISWHEVAKHVGTRSYRQCRGRWYIIFSGGLVTTEAAVGYCKIANFSLQQTSREAQNVFMFLGKQAHTAFS